MKKRNRQMHERTSLAHIIINPLISIALIIAAFFFSDYSAAFHSAQTVREELTASANEQVNTLEATWTGQVDTLRAVAIKMADYSAEDADETLKSMQKLCDETSFSHVSFALEDGICHVPGMEPFDVFDRMYFKKAMNGEQSIQRIDDARSGEGTMFVLAVPIEKDGRITGLVQGSYTEQVLSSIIIPGIYDGRAYCVICREDGSVAIGTDNPQFEGESGNFFTDMTAAFTEVSSTEDEVKANIAAGVTGTLRYKLNGEGKYAVYVPLDTRSADGSRLVLFNILPQKVIDDIAQHHKLDNALMFVTILFASILTAAAFIYSAHKSAMELSRQMKLLKASEEQTRIATEESGLLISRYDLQTGTYHNDSDILTALGYGRIIENVPQTFIDGGLVAPESVDEFRAFYDNLRKGVNGTLIAKLKTPDNDFRWFRKDATFVTDDDGKPYQAIVKYRDVTDQLEREAVYLKWKQSIEQRDEKSYTLFRCNLTKGTTYNNVEGKLLMGSFSEKLQTFNEMTRDYASRRVDLNDYDEYVNMLNSENLLAGYYRGINSVSMDYRERTKEEEYRWLRVTAEIIQLSVTNDIEVFLLYENLNDRADPAPERAAQSDKDSMTGVLTRNSFVEQFGELIKALPEKRHALILADIDDFKTINSVYGHTGGDQALTYIAGQLSELMQEGDILGRLGGDEFLICLGDVASHSVAEQRAMQIQAAMRITYSLEVSLSASLGIAVYPSDGKDFSSLYRGVDIALALAKANGRDSYAFYNGETSRPQITEKSTNTKASRKHMLVIEDNTDTVDLIKSTFGDEYSYDVCIDDKQAISQMYRLGAMLSCVLLNLDISTFDYSAFYNKRRSIEILTSVPVIAMSNPSGRDRCLEALEKGASDFILLPIAKELLKIRVSSAESRAEAVRLRTQVQYLQTHSGDLAQYRSVFENTGTVVVEYDWQRHVFTYDPTISRHIYGRYDDRSLWQIFLSDMVAGTQDVKKIQRLVLEIANDRSRTSGTMDMLLKTPEKEKHWFTLNIFKRLGDRALTSKIIMTLLDVNDSIIASKKLQFQALHDELTGLYNRSTFIKQVDERVGARDANTYILLRCDINGFRFINEHFGREEGDKLLQYTGDKLLSYADALNGLAGRLSNDVFALLLPYNGGLMDKLIKTAPEFFADYPLNTKVTGRIGVYVVDDPSLSADLIIDRASLAADSIRGKFNCWVAAYDPSMSDRLLQEKSITDRMESALANGEFVIYIQPQYSHSTGRIVGAEALTRWIDPERGIISPGVFIPIFEKNGFIAKLDEYVWSRAAQLLSEWIQRGYEPVPISVNVSREDTNDPGLCGKLLAIVEKYNIPIQLFRLEITESLFAENTEHLVAVLKKLHDAGFLVEMDDFGSGYSSLNILKDVPVDIIKLDMRFFSGRDELGRGGMITNSILRMARWLNIPVIAEGVEEKEQADFLLSIGCPTIQGYLYAKPMPAEELEKKLAENRVMNSICGDAVETGLNLTEFWNPSAADSQLFNNYLGAAAFFEYHGGKYEILRMNRKFLKTMNIDQSLVLPASGIINFVEEDRPVFKKAVLETIYSGKNTKVQVHCTMNDGSRKELNITMCVIAKSAERAFIFGMLDE